MDGDDKARSAFREFFQDLDERDKIKNDIATECQDVLDNVVRPTLIVLSEENKNKRVKIREDLSVIVVHEDGEGYDKLTFQCRGREFSSKMELAGHSYLVGSSTQNLSAIDKDWVTKELVKFLGEALKSRKKIRNLMASV